MFSARGKKIRERQLESLARQKKEIQQRERAKKEGFLCLHRLPSTSTNENPFETQNLSKTFNHRATATDTKRKAYFESLASDRKKQAQNAPPKMNSQKADRTNKRLEALGKKRKAFLQKQIAQNNNNLAPEAERGNIEFSEKSFFFFFQESKMFCLEFGNIKELNSRNFFFPKAKWGNKF